jgi:type IV secretion system protein VirD4
MKRDNPKQAVVMCAFGIVLVVWAALLTAPSISGSLMEIIRNLTVALNNPLEITWCEDSLKTVLIFIAAYAMGMGIYFSTRRNTRPREEHGSAKWGDDAVINRKYADKLFSQNKILTQNVRIGLDSRKHQRNLNVMVVGGSGSGKTRFYAKPNAMQANTSMVIIDPKGGVTRSQLKRLGVELNISRLKGAVKT